MKKGILLSLIFVAVVAAAVAVSANSQNPVYAQSCSSCSSINDPSDCDNCGGRLYCTCACGVLCERPNNCACEATLCQTSPNGEECGYDVYGNPLTCFWCGGTPKNCSFDCPGWINPCITPCDGGNGNGNGGPTPTLPPGTPTPTLPPGIPTPTPTPTPTPAPTCSAPGGLSGSASCDGGDGLIDVVWSWSAVAGTIDYLINVDNNSDFSSPELSIFTSSTSYTAVDLAPGTWYARVRVNTSDASCSSPSSWSATASITNSCSACASPSNNAPSSSCVDQSTYDITWNFSESAGANEYQFAISTCSGGGFFGCVVYDSGWQSPAFFSCGGGSCSLPMTGFTSGTTYYSRIRAQGAACPTSAWSNEQSAFQDCFVTCTAPIGLSGIGVCDLGDGLLDISWSWGAVVGGTSYRLQVDDDPAFGSPNVNGPPTALTSQDTNNLTPGTWYARVLVETDDGITCTAPSVWSSASFTEACLASVQGTVYDDPFNQASFGASGICEFPGPLPGKMVSSGLVTIDDDLGGVWTDSVDGSGDYSVDNVPIGTDLYDATFTPVSFVCMCPAPDPGNPGSCFPYTDIIDAPQTGVNFFVSQVRERWAQTVGGDVHVKGDIGLTIPDTCVASPICSPEFSIPGTDDFGVVSSSTGSTDYGPSGSVSIPGWEAASDYLGPELLFDFWRKETDSPTALSDCDLTAPPAASGVYEVNCTANFSLTGDWSNISENITIFVNFEPSNLTLTLNPSSGITLASGGLVTIITDGSVQVADTVTQIEGIYLVDDVFRTCVIDDCGYDDATGIAYQLQVNGTVIGWSGVDLERDLFTKNVDTPGELFTYEPEFIPRLPEFILRAIYTWEEVAP